MSGSESLVTNTLRGTTASDKPQPTHTLRKSCHFCRARKIRCSGQTICGACRERNIECSYEREGSKGRPKGSISQASSRSRRVGAASSAASTSATVAPSNILTWVEQDLPLDSRITPRSSTTGSLSEQEIGPEKSIGTELQHIFRKIFINHEKDPTHPIDDAFVNFARKNKENSGRQENVAFPTDCNMSYEGLFFVIAQELVELVALRFGDLGCDYLEPSQSRYMITCLTHDHTDSMFDSVVCHENPLIGFDNPQTLQTIEVWFSNHPLSFILSKTLLLRALRNNTYDKVLLAVILADINCAQEDEQARTRGREMFNWAISRLRVREIDNTILPAIQALIILGWHELCASRVRRAVSYLGLAGCLIHELQPPKMGVNLINGIDIGEVELEVICNAHWLVFSITVWALMQIDSHISELLPATAPTSFPPIDELASAIFRLDKQSDNLSTLPNQARMFRELWPLSHIASTTAHIYALYPQKQETEDTLDTSSWQDRTLRQLRHLSSVRQDISLLCAKIRHVLINAIELVETHVENHLLQALVLSAYHTMIIHFLFPRLDDNSETGPIPDKLINDLCSSAHALLKAFSIIDRPADGGRVIMGLRSSSVADIFALGLDACGRAMNRIYDHDRSGSGAEKKRLGESCGELLELATALHGFSKHSKILPSPRASRVKKQLKLAMRNLKSIHLNFNILDDTMLLRNTGPGNSFDLTSSNANPHYSSFNPSLIKSRHTGDGMLHYFRPTEQSAAHPFDTHGNMSNVSSRREDGSQESITFPDEMQLGGMSIDSATFDLSFLSAPIEYGGTAAGENHELGSQAFNEYVRK